MSYNPINKKLNKLNKLYLEMFVLLFKTVNQKKNKKLYNIILLNYLIILN